MDFNYDHNYSNYHIAVEVVNKHVATVVAVTADATAYYSQNFEFPYMGRYHRSIDKDLGGL